MKNIQIIDEIIDVENDFINFKLCKPIGSSSSPHLLTYKITNNIIQI